MWSSGLRPQRSCHDLSWQCPITRKMAPSVQADNLRSQREALTMVLTARLRPRGAMPGLGFMVAFTATINNSTQPTQAEPQAVHKYMPASTQRRAAAMGGACAHGCWDTFCTQCTFNTNLTIKRCTTALVK